MKKKIRWIVMEMLLLGVLALSACAGTNTEGEEQAKPKESSADLSMFEEDKGDVWRESWTEKTASGEAVSVNINSLIRVPKFERMSTVEVCRYNFSVETKKKLIESVFGDEIYYHDLDKLPKSEIKILLEEAKEGMEWSKEDLENVKKDSSNNQYEEVLKDARQELQESEDRVKKWEKLLKNAPDDYVRLEENDYTGESYLGKMNGIDFVISMGNSEEGEDTSAIYLHPMDNTQIEPDRIQGRENQYFAISFEEQESENICTLKKEEAEELAADFLQKTGFPDQVKITEENLKWVLYEDGQESTESFYDGYVFTFGPGVDGIAFKSFGTEIGAYSMGGKSYVYGQYSMDCFVTVIVTDKGVIEATWFNPIEIVSTTPDVKLLPLDTVKEIMKNEMSEFADFCSQEQGNYYVKFNRLDLIYYRVADPDKKDYFTYIPAWRLSRDGQGCLIVNAMDGSVIHDWDSLYQGEWIF